MPPSANCDGQSDIASNKALPKVDLYTDGSAQRNPGPGGYGIVLKSGKHRKELSGGFAQTTNNRMELMAAIVGFQTLKRPCNVTLHSDSRYLIDSLSMRWVHKWKSKGWKKSTGEDVPNADLWQLLLDVIASHHIEYQWIRGHNGHIENERCDQLATQAAASNSLAQDTGYIQR